MIPMQLVFVLLRLLLVTMDEINKLLNNMVTEEIVPQIIDELPTKSIIIQFGNDTHVRQGNVLTKQQNKDRPMEVTWSIEDGVLYSLFVIDPDAPSRVTPFFGQVVHWMIINIEGNQLSTGEEIFSWRGSGAPPLTGLHRYIFLVFKQNGQVSLETNFNKGKLGRMRFNIRNFAKEYKLGQPIAGNFFQARF